MGRPRRGRPPKSEFASTVTAKLPRDLIDRIDDFADYHFDTRATAIESLLRAGLDALK